MMKNQLTLLMLAVIATLGSSARGAGPTLEERLQRATPEEVVKYARVLGDARRGAAVFYQPGLSCVQCHNPEVKDELLGPKLSALGKRANYQHVIESILYPSKKVEQGFQVERVLLEDGQVITGLIKKDSDKELTLVVPGEEQPRVISLDDVEARKVSDSIMPTGLINQLESVSDFYDLVSYVVALGEAGPDGDASLVPPQELVELPPLPAYESDLDHAGLIKSWNQKSFTRGKALYNGLCINCHGNKEAAGSLPNALRFFSGKFGKGSDPYSMYQTLTHGYKMMLPQRQLVPREKYDVIHFIREEYLRDDNPSQYIEVDSEYLSSLPKGKMRGPAPVKNAPWIEMDYGPFLISTYEITGPKTKPRQGITEEERRRARKENRPAGETWPENTNFAYKGIAIRLDRGEGGVAAGSHWLAFDHDTMRVAGAWSGKGFMDWKGILFNGNHAITPRTVGHLHFGSLPGPGWADPVSGTFEDPRIVGKDGRHYGPLPADWAKYRGLYKFGDRVAVAYTVGTTDILEAHGIEQRDGAVIWKRTLNVGVSDRTLKLRLAPTDSAIVAINAGLQVVEEAGYWVVPIAARTQPLHFDVLLAEKGTSQDVLTFASEKVEDLKPLTEGGPAAWPESLATQPEVGDDEGPFAVDTLSRPVDNPWKSRLRMSGLDFSPDGNTLYACCCDGDVWRVDGVSSLSEQITWKRIASGLFHPLGLKLVEGRIFVTCRDQIVVLNDLNGDGEADFYECFNNDHQVTDHFHEFAMGLQADDDGNLYYAKSARHARDSLVPQHGTLLKVSADGSETTILANGFRAANGVCINPDGSFFVTDQEGHWNPMNRINRVVEGGFYGNMYSYGAPADSSDSAMEQPLCWPNKPFDRSPSELLWVDSEAWGPFNGSLLNLSYGYGKVYVVPHEKVDGMWQGGMCRLPLPRFPTGVMRARFHPQSGQMYACGLHAWGSDQSASPGGLYRIRYTGKTALLPVGLSALDSGVRITFSEPLNRNGAANVENYLVDTWALKRTKNYGSDRYDEKSLEIQRIDVSSDGRSVLLQIAEIEPTWCMEISYKLEAEDGTVVQGTIQNTVHRLANSVETN